MPRRRYLILSDIHANLEALDAVLRAVSRRRYDRVLCLGDLVGYGANPDPVISRVRRLPGLVTVRGNHDKVVAGHSSADNFNASARRAAEWTAARVSRDNLSFVRALPRGPVHLEDGLLLCHGSVQDEDAYLFSDYDAHEAFDAASFRVGFFGHTHFPCAFRHKGQEIDFIPLKGEHVELELDPEARYLFNPGSVGQPRDRNPRAAFAEYYPDSGRFVLRRVAYDAGRAREKILKAGLPENLGNRLLVGT